MISHSPEVSEETEKEELKPNKSYNIESEVASSIKEKEVPVSNIEIELDENLKSIRDLLRIPKGDKTIEQLNFLLNFLLQFNFFRFGIETYGKNTLISLIDSSEFIKCEKDQIIINIGETNKSVFILLSGVIKISSRNPLVNYSDDDEEEDIKLDENANVNLFLYGTFQKINHDSNFMFAESLDKLNHQNNKLLIPNHLNPLNIEDEWFVQIGEIFGDKSLIERKTCALSYKALKESYLLEIKKKDFYAFIEPIRREEYLRELKFYHSITIFSEFSRNAIERLKFNLKEKKYLKGEIVIEQNYPINDIYIVKSGSFQITYKSTKNIVNEFDLNYYSNITPLDFRFTENRRHEIKGFKKTEENLKLFTVEKGQFIGDLEFINKRGKSYFTITCSQKDSILISMPRYVFLKHFKEFKEDFNLFTKERENYYKKRFKKLTAISRAFCFDNPETRYLNDLVVRIKDGMEFIKSQEEKSSRTKRAQSATCSQFVSKTFNTENSKLDSRNKINNHTLIANLNYKEVISSYNLEEDIINNCNGGGSFQEKFQKIKRKLNKKNSVKNLTDIRVEETGSKIKMNKRVSVFNKDYFKLNNDVNSKNVKNPHAHKVKNLTGSELSLHKFKYGYKINSKNEERERADSPNRINMPSKVVELFTRIKSASRASNNVNSQLLFNCEIINRSNNLDFTIINKDNDNNFNNNQVLKSSKELKDLSNLVKIKTNLDTINLVKNAEDDEKFLNQKNYSPKKSPHKLALEKVKNTKSLGDKILDKADKHLLKRIQKKNKSVIPCKIKIKKSAYEEWKKENYNSSDDSTDLLLFDLEKKDKKNKTTVNKATAVESKKKEIIRIKENKMLLPNAVQSYKQLSEPKIAEKLKSNKLIISRNHKSTEKLFTNEILKSENLNHNFQIHNNICSTNKTSHYFFESPREEQNYVLDTNNKEIGELNCELYTTKNKSEIPENLKKEREIIKSKLDLIQITNEKSNNFNNLSNKGKQIEKLEDAKNQKENNSLCLNNNKNKNQAKDDLALKQIKFENESVKRGVSTAVGASRIKQNLDIQEAWIRKKTELFKALEAKSKMKNISKSRKKKITISSSKLKSNGHGNNENKQNPNELYYSVVNKTQNLTKSKSENTELKVNVGLFVKENFDKEKSIFNLSSNKGFLESSEVSKNIFLNAKKISNILNKKYNYLKNNCQDKSIEKSSNLVKSK